MQVGCSYYETRFCGAKRKKVLTRDTFCYVPLLSTLKQILKIPNIRQEISRRPNHDGNLMYDLSDGAMFKKHDFFKNNPSGIQIIAYYDEVETCNPLGSSSGKFKLGCIFFTLGNLKPLHRSNLKAIFLVAVAKSSTIKTNGIDSILEPFVKDLKTLSDTGVTLCYKGKEEVWKGSLLAFLADNLAAHEVGGFKESFSFSRRFCRSCMTDKEQSQEHFQEDQFLIRTAESHADQCSRLDGPQRSTVSVEFGINRVPLLSSLPYFSVIDGIPHDIMHDLYEGVIPYELKLLLTHCTSKSYFEVHTLDQRLRAFNFGYTEIGDKPAPIEDISRLRQSASQMWLLARILPLLVGDLIPRNDNNWLCFLKLLKISEICTANVLSEDTAAFLKLLIEEHHSEFKLLYPGETITPKMHFMIHFSRQILNYGPLIHTWTMRHESKLRIIKRAARVSNYKNVCQTVAKRHQHLLCYYMHTDMILKPPVQIGSCKLYTLATQPQCVKILLEQKFQLTEESILFSPSFVICNGRTFKSNAFILYHFDALEPIFCKISTIIKTQTNKVVLVLNEYVTQYYDNHYHAFCIKDTSTVHVCLIDDLPFNFIFHLRQTFVNVYNMLYLSYKYIEAN